MTTEYIGFFNDNAYRVIDGNIVYAKDLNNPLAALEAGVTALVNAVQTGATIWTATDTGSANAYVINPTAALTELTDGQMVWLKPGATNTGASTINVSSLGAKNIRSTVRTALVGGELISGYWHMLKYSSTLDAFVISSERGRTDLDIEKTIAGIGVVVTSNDDTITITGEAALGNPSGNDMVLVSQTNGVRSWSNRIQGKPFFHAQDQKAYNVDGGTSIADAWTKRTLNTVITNDIQGASLASDQVSLPAGIYYVEGSAPFQPGGPQTGILSVFKDGVIALQGSTEFIDSSYTQISTRVSGVLNLTAPGVVDIRQYLGIAKATSGLGVSNNGGSITDASIPSIFADLKIWQLSGSTSF